MNLKSMFFRDEQETSVDVFQCWEVRWTSRHGQYHGDTRREVRVFPKKEDAGVFRDALQDAFELVKHTSGTRVSLTKQEI